MMILTEKYSSIWYLEVWYLLVCICVSSTTYGNMSMDPLWVSEHDAVSCHCCKGVVNSGTFPFPWVFTIAIVFYGTTFSSASRPPSAVQTGSCLSQTVLNITSQQPWTGWAVWPRARALACTYLASGAVWGKPSQQQYRKRVTLAVGVGLWYREPGRYNMLNRVEDRGN